MPTRSNSPRAMIENSASPLAEAIAPTDAVEAEITPPTGACTAICPPSGSVSRASTWPAVTLSPASTITSETFSPIRSGRTWFSSRGMMVPDTSTILAKQAFAALSTVTAAPFGGRLVVGGKGGAGKQAEHPRCDQGGQLRAKGRARGWSSAFRSPVSVSQPIPEGPQARQAPRSHPSAPRPPPPAPLRAPAERLRVRPRGRYAAAIAGLTDDAWVSGSIWPAAGKCRISAQSMISPSRCTMRWVTIGRQPARKQQRRNAKRGRRGRDIFLGERRREIERKLVGALDHAQARAFRQRILRTGAVPERHELVDRLEHRSIPDVLGNVARDLREARVQPAVRVALAQQRRQHRLDQRQAAHPVRERRTRSRS